VERSAARRRALFDRYRHHVAGIAGWVLVAEVSTTAARDSNIVVTRPYDEVLADWRGRSVLSCARPSDRLLGNPAFGVVAPGTLPRSPSIALRYRPIGLRP